MSGLKLWQISAQAVDANRLIAVSIEIQSSDRRNVGHHVAGVIGQCMGGLVRPRSMDWHQPARSLIGGRNAWNRIWQRRVGRRCIETGRLHWIRLQGGSSRNLLCADGDILKRLNTLQQQSGLTTIKGCGTVFDQVSRPFPQGVQDSMDRL